MKESANLDVLRTAAVSFVVVDHLVLMLHWPRPRFLDLTVLGILGVMFFFVHTCLVLMFSLERQVARQGERRLWPLFITRRIFRLYPLSVVLILLLYFSHVPTFGTAHSEFVYHPVSALTLWSNVFLIQNITDTVSILPVLWSLPWEMQMYLFLPPLFLLARRLSVRGFVVLWVLSVIAAMLQFHFQHKENLLRYLPCFLPGVMAYRINMDRPRQVSVLWFAAFLVITPFLFVAVEALGRGAVFRGMPICFLLGWMLPRVRDVRAPWVRTVSKYVARYSYGIYLVHWPVLWLAFRVLHGIPSPLQWLVFFGGTLGISALLFHALEAPMIQLGNRVTGYALRPARPAAEPLPEPTPAP